MDPPRFEHAQLSSALCAKDCSLDEAFARFVVDALRDTRANLHLFPHRGKDGAIDFVSDVAGGRTVGECKLVASDGLTKLLARWKEISGRLARNLTNEAPPPGQGQYGPWFRTDLPIREYLLCTSATLQNQEQQDSIEGEIRDFFAELSSNNPHLEHLSGVQVHVLDWRELWDQAATHLRFRWFPGTRPIGLVPLEEWDEQRTFRAYLGSERLPYYSLKDHLKSTPPPPGLAIPDEESIVDALAAQDKTGLLVSGAGGLGKTRLMLEIGHIARRQGWTVFYATTALKDDAVDILARQLEPGEPVLLLIDYVETQPAFLVLAERIALNLALQHRVRYVANCRTSYLPTVIGIDGQDHLSLAPVGNEPEIAWWRDYRHRTVDHILAAVGLPIDERHLAIARDQPILAVFLAHLAFTDRLPELNELLGTGDFAAWVLRRIQRSFGTRGVSRDLALLSALLPIASEQLAAEELDGRFSELRDKLAADGWIEQVLRRGGEHTWRSIHDVLMDQVVTGYLQGVPKTVDSFVRDLIALAAQLGVFESALATLHRLANQPIMEAVDWSDVLEAAIASDPELWRFARALVLRTPLLSTGEIVDLLAGHDDMWRDMEYEQEVQLSLGRLAQRAVEDEPLRTDQRETLENWLEHAAAAASRSNFVITRALRYCPERVADVALRWLRNHPQELQADFLLVAWLKAGLPHKEVRPLVAAWLSAFSDNQWASFLIREWLHATADTSFVRGAMTAWLGEHSATAQAGFVYGAWLEAAGEINTVHEPLEGWLKIHGTEPEAAYVYRAWLEADGDLEVVREPIVKWLELHADDGRAPLVSLPWLLRRGEVEVAGEAISAWLGSHADLFEASFALRTWLVANGDPELVLGPLRHWLELHATEADARFVYQAWLDATRDPDTVREPISKWLERHGNDLWAQFIYKAWLDADGELDLVRDSIEGWLGSHGDSAEAGFVFKAWLDANGDIALVRRSLGSWVELHAETPAAVFVYGAWLNAGGEIETVRPALSRWLKSHANVADAVFVYRAWLDRGGGTEVIRTPIENWLRDHADDPGASFVYKGWLDAGGEPEFLDGPIRTWLARHADNFEADFVYRAWLEAGGGHDAVRAPIDRWLTSHAEAPSARFIYKAWLDSKGELEFMRERIRSWLDLHATEAHARFVYQSWLDAGGDLELVRDAIGEWLKHHAAIREARFVYKPWLDSKGELDLVRQPITSWLEKHAEDSLADVVGRAWLEADGEPELVASRIRSS